MDRGESESEQLRSEAPKLKPGKGRQRYEQLRSYRDAWLQRAQRASRLTLPYLIPDSAEGMQDQSQELAMPWSGIGGLGVNNLAARLLLALLPPTGGFFRLTGDELDTAMAEADLSDLLPHIAVPTLLIWGDADPISPVAAGRRLRELLPASRLEVFAGGEHDVATDFAPEVATLIDEHLAPQPWSILPQPASSAR